MEKVPKQTKKQTNPKNPLQYQGYGLSLLTPYPKYFLDSFPTIPEEYFIDPYLFLNNFFFVAFYTLVVIYLITYNYSADGNVFPLASHSVRTGTVPLAIAALTPNK